MTPNTADDAGLADDTGLPVAIWDIAAREFAAWREGDPGALERLVRRVTPTLWQTARSCGLGREAAEDTVQATWLALVRRADSIRDPQAVLRWMVTTTHREAWKAGRLSQREATVEEAVLDAVSPPVEGPEGAVLTQGTARALWRQVARLPQRCQQLLRVIAFDHRPDYAALADRLGMPVGSIGPTRGRCLDKLRTLLAADPEWEVGP
ncbi:RNA polymerase sigma factor [Streptomyces sp. NBC_01262]|uniref:RNA polymerase sigma factor n=1 Tax=Streptomyces sp. NBC_01262 TaxID=2903803 RepID=UPI002E318A1F|nr:sigma-70 family RNA polymerase sigma factor [Streptomyces sp. NBC_01262]